MDNWTDKCFTVGMRNTWTLVCTASSSKALPQMMASSSPQCAVHTKRTHWRWIANTKRQVLKGPYCLVHINDMHQPLQVQIKCTIWNNVNVFSFVTLPIATIKKH